MYTGEFFGKRDAEEEDAGNLSKYFYRLGLLDELKTNKKSKGACIVVGVKGSGKTAICRTVEKSHQKSGITWKLKLADGFSVEDEKKQSSHYESFLVVYLLSGLISLIRENKDNFSEEAIKQLPGAIERLKGLVSRVFKHTKASVGNDGLGISFEIGELLKEGQRELSHLGVEKFKEVLNPCLTERQAVILIDDVDEIFPNSDMNYEFIEGLIASAVKINNAFGNLVHCLVFMKAGPYSRYFEHGRNYDKYADSAVVIRWDSTELVEMLATRCRVATGFDKENEESWRSLQRAFDGNKEITLDIQEYMISRCNSGPRDLIILANFAKQAAGDRKIRIDDIEASEAQYSREKLFLLNRDYERQYGDIANLLAKVFRNKPVIFSKGKIEELIQTEILGNAEIMRGGFGSMELLRSADASSVMEKLFDFGFIGFRDNTNSDFIYMMDMQSQMIQPGQRLFHAYEHRIHPAYETHLRLKQKDGKSLKR